MCVSHIELCLRFHHRLCMIEEDACSGGDSEVDKAPGCPLVGGRQWRGFGRCHVWWCGAAALFSHTHTHRETSFVKEGKEVWCGSQSDTGGALCSRSGEVPD